MKSIPDRVANKAYFVGQFSVLTEDAVCMVEYSGRSAQVAVYSPLGIDRKPPSVFKGVYDPRVLYRAFIALHEING